MSNVTANRRLTFNTHTFPSEDGSTKYKLVEIDGDSWSEKVDTSGNPLPETVKEKEILHNFMNYVGDLKEEDEYQVMQALKIVEKYINIKRSKQTTINNENRGTLIDSPLYVETCQSLCYSDRYLVMIYGFTRPIGVNTLFLIERELHNSQTFGDDLEIYPNYRSAYLETVQNPEMFSSGICLAIGFTIVKSKSYQRRSLEDIKYGTTPFSNTWATSIHEQTDGIVGIKRNQSGLNYGCPDLKKHITPQNFSRPFGQ